MESRRLNDIDHRIAELRTLLAELEQASQKIREHNQHEAVDQLEEYLDASVIELDQMSLFKDEVMNELRAMLNKVKGLLSTP